MPKYKTHLLGGFITYITIFLLLNYFFVFKKNILLYLISCLIGSLFPDIDTKSKIQQKLYYLFFVIIIFMIFLEKWKIASFLGLVITIPLLINHRKLTHKVCFLVIIPLIIPILAFNYSKELFKPAFICYLFFIAGSISHLILDFGIFNFFSKKY